MDQTYSQVARWRKISRATVREPSQGRHLSQRSWDGP